MLRAFARWILREEATPTRKRHVEPDVSREMVEAMLEEHMKQVNYEWNEWYEKFDKLHLRLAKRAARDAAKNQPLAPLEEIPQSRPSALHFRRPGSV